MADHFPEEDDEVAIDATLVHETDSAVLLDIGADEPVWFPKSQIAHTDADEWTMPRWLALKTGAV